MAVAQLARRVAAVRRFNRFYTRRIGVLNEGFLGSSFSLSEGRVLFELAQRPDVTATVLREVLGLDPGYLSRILGNLEKRGLVTRTTSEADGRVNHLNLTDRGREAFATLDTRSSEEVAALLATIPVASQRKLLNAMQAIEEVLDAPSRTVAPYRLRTHQPGDMGWVVYRHGVLYAQEYGWDERSEALAAEVVASFVKNYDPKRERCWIAEQEGEIVGYVFLVKRSKTVAQLRLLLVEPSARGLGLGRRLVDECIGFARRAGYRKVMLWTNSVLEAARHIYEEVGFRLVKEEPHNDFGVSLVGQTWELEL
ncbi:MAG TPA: helix-turn-helix domain-containing GNAT family N-acetyltransferase [Gemmatimonadaceae bacterium]|nr:helix-turn-helix domain-containing GNAT family N-acetyltransferase [Gemmatimonadaceae bacterium]